MAKESMTVRVEARTRQALDRIANTLDRDRTYVVNEAIESYIELHRWQLEHIQGGVRDADAGRFATDAEVERMIAKLSKK